MAECHYPHEAIAEIMGFAVELNGRMTAEDVWNHYATQAGTQLARIAKNAELQLDDLKADYLTTVSDALAGKDTFHSISVENYSRAFYQEQLETEYFSKPKMALYGKTYIMASQVTLVTKDSKWPDGTPMIGPDGTGRIEPEFAGDTTKPFKEGHYIVHPFARDNQGRFVKDPDTGEFKVNKLNGYTIPDTKFPTLYKAEGNKFISTNRGYIHWLDSAMAVRPSWDPHLPQTIQPGGAIYKSITLGEIYGAPEAPMVESYARLDDNGQQICLLSEDPEDQYKALLTWERKHGDLGITEHLQDLATYCRIHEIPQPGKHGGTSPSITARQMVTA